MIRDSTVPTTVPSPVDPLPDLTASPLYLLAVLTAARKSKDRALEEVTRRRLDKLGVRVIFASEMATPQEGVRHAD